MYSNDEKTSDFILSPCYLIGSLHPMFTLRYRKSRDNLSSSDVKLSSRMLNTPLFQVVSRFCMTSFSNTLSRSSYSFSCYNNMNPCDIRTNFVRKSGLLHSSPSSCTDIRSRCSSRTIWMCGSNVYRTWTEIRSWSMQKRNDLNVRK